MLLLLLGEIKILLMIRAHAWNWDSSEYDMLQFEFRALLLVFFVRTGKFSCKNILLNFRAGRGPDLRRRVASRSDCDGGRDNGEHNVRRRRPSGHGNRHRHFDGSSRCSWGRETAEAAVGSTVRSLTRCADAPDIWNKRNLIQTGIINVRQKVDHVESWPT